MKTKIILSIVGGLLALSAWLVGLVPQSPLGGISSTQQYNSTTTRSTSGAGTTSYVAMLGQGTFGSIVVTQPATAGYVRVFDATSTATSTAQSANPKDTGVTVFAPIAHVLSASDVVGTLIYDLQIYKGVVIETAADFNGEYVITFRN